MVEEKKKELLEYFKYLDPHFFTNYKKLIDAISSKELTEYDVDTILQNEIAANQGVNPNVIVETCIDFFRSINPLYGEMAKSIIRDPSHIKFSVPKSPDEAMDSPHTNMIINQNWNDILTLVHEITHSFVTTSDDREALKRIGFIDSLLLETAPIVAEYLAKDYIKEKHGIDISSLDKLRIASIQKYGNEVFRYDSYRDIIGFIENPSISNPRMDSDIEKNRYTDINDKITGLNSYFNHNLGVLIANYIYIKIKENPENIKLFDGLLTILAKGPAYTEESIQLLTEMGIPIVNDGKISLNEENIKKLYDSYFKKFGKYYTPNNLSDNDSQNKQSKQLNSEDINPPQKQNKNIKFQIKKVDDEEHKDNKISDEIKKEEIEIAINAITPEEDYEFPPRGR